MDIRINKIWEELNILKDDTSIKDTGFYFSVSERISGVHTQFDFVSLATEDDLRGFIHTAIILYAERIGVPKDKVMENIKLICNQQSLNPNDN